MLPIIFFPKFVCVLFFCCYFVVFHSMVPITLARTVELHYFITWAVIVHSATLSLVCQEGFFSARRSFLRFWLFSSLEFQLVFNHKQCSISNVMANSEFKLLLSLKLPGINSTKFSLCGTILLNLLVNIFVN